MRTREQRWAARTARGWPRTRVHAVLNGLLALGLGVLVLYLTHGALQFRNYPALDVPWFWRTVSLFVAVTVPFVLIAMGAYLVLLAFTSTSRAAMAAGRARAVVLATEAPDAPEVSAPALPETAPPGVRIRAHGLHVRGVRRYTRELLGVLPVQSPLALIPPAIGALALVIATVYYATGYGRPALIALAGAAYLGWKLFRGYRSYRFFAAETWLPRHTTVDDAAAPPPRPGTVVPAGVAVLRDENSPYDSPAERHWHDTEDLYDADDEITRPLPRQRVRADREEYVELGERLDDGSDPHDEVYVARPYSPSAGEEPAEITDELPVIERIRDTYSTPRRSSGAQRRLAERAEREQARAKRRGTPRSDRATSDSGDDAAAGTSRAMRADRAGSRGGNGASGTNEAYWSGGTSGGNGQEPRERRRTSSAGTGHGAATEQHAQREGQERYERYLAQHQRNREDRISHAQAQEPEQAPSLFHYVAHRWRGRKDGS